MRTVNLSVLLFLLALFSGCHTAGKPLIQSGPAAGANPASGSVSEPSPPASRESRENGRNGTPLPASQALPPIQQGQQLNVQGSLAVVWPADPTVKLSSEPLRGSVELVGDKTLRIELPADAIRARLEPSAPLIATLRQDGPIETTTDINLRLDPGSLKDARLGIDWGTPPTLKADTATSETSRELPAETFGWVALILMWLLASGLVLGLRWLGTGSVVSMTIDQKRSIELGKVVDQPGLRWLKDYEDVAFTFAAPLFVPVFLDVLGKSLMKDLDKGGAGVLVVFFCYCFAAAWLGARFVLPLVRAVEGMFTVMQLNEQRQADKR
jgi:hypothetical protein